MIARAALLRCLPRAAHRHCGPGAAAAPGRPCAPAPGIHSAGAHRRGASCMAAPSSPPPRPPTADELRSAEGLRAASCSLVGGCSPDTPKVPPEQLPGLLAAVPAWRLSADGRSISRAFTAKNFVAAVDFVNRLTPVVEAEGHHPDLHITNWRDVEVVLMTHAIGGLAMADFVMAAKLDAVPVDYSPKWLKEQQAAGAAAPGAAAPGAAAPPPAAGGG